MKSFQCSFGAGYKLVCHAPKKMGLRVGCRQCSRD
jgi:hypothetical protein